MTLLQNVLAQMAEMHAMAKRPKALRCDRASLEALAHESKLPEMLIPGARLFGLTIEIDTKPNFEVV